MQKILIPLLSAATMLATHATTLHYAVSGGSVSAQTTDPKLAPNAFNLDDGQSAVFPFFVIRTPESTVNTSDPNDDTHPYPISATLTFSDPSTSAPNSGSTVGTIGADVFLPILGGITVE